MRRSVVAEMLEAHLADPRRVSPVDEVGGDFYHVGPVRPGRRENAADVLVDLPALGYGISRADRVAVLVAADLAGEL